jgi:hypothetical protein
MKPRLALTIGSVLALVFGLSLLLAPDPMLRAFGLSPHTDGLVVSRDVGVMLVGLAILNWLARAAEPGPALRAVLVANLAVQVLEIAVNGAEIVMGDLPSAAAPGLGIHVVLGAIFALALARPDKAF